VPDALRCHVWPPSSRHACAVTRLDRVVLILDRHDALARFLSPDEASLQ
jgi:hypothetical protein